MMPSDLTNHDLMQAWKNGDQAAAALLFHRYQTRLLALIRSRLSRKLARRIDPEDILLSAYRSFFVGAATGPLLAAADDDLWPLLTTITLRKLKRQVRRHTAQRRSVDQEQFADSQIWESVLVAAPTAEHAAVLSDELERLLSCLDETASEVLVRTLQGQPTTSIARSLHIHERSVRRALERIRALLPSEGTDITFPLNVTGGMRPAAIVERRTKSFRLGTASDDRYLLQQFVGAGAFSKVYRAWDRVSHETVAVKFLRKDCWHDRRAAEALIREYDILRKLDHPQILAIRDWGTTLGGAVFLVSDFIHGANLDAWREAARPSVEQILSAVRDVAVAVSAAHVAGVIHGDLKPANVLLREDGRIVLCDFGLSRYVNDPDDVPRGGTAGFLAPEQISDAFGQITVQSDVYGLGGMIYALLTGQPPMTGSDLPEILANVLSLTSPIAPSRLGTSSPDIDRLVLRCLEKEPARRYPSVDELLADWPTSARRDP